MRRRRQIQRDYAALGDIICTEGDCQIGRTLVAQMQSIYPALAQSQGPAFIARFKPTYDAISKAYDDLDTWAVRWLPFHPGCCEIKVVGGQAQDLLQQMQQYAGVATTSNIHLPGPSQDIIDAANRAADTGLDFLDIVKWGAFAFVALYVYKELK